MFVTFPFQKLSSFLWWLSFCSVISSLRLISMFSDYLLFKSCSSFNILSVSAFLSALKADLSCSALFLSSIVFTFSISSSCNLFSISAYWAWPCSTRSLSSYFWRYSTSWKSFRVDVSSLRSFLRVVFSNVKSSISFFYWSRWSVTLLSLVKKSSWVWILWFSLFKNSI